MLTISSQRRGSKGKSETKSLRSAECQDLTEGQNWPPQRTLIPSCSGIDWAAHYATSKTHPPFAW